MEGESSETASYLGTNSNVYMKKTETLQSIPKLTEKNVYCCTKYITNMAKNAVEFNYETKRTEVAISVHLDVLGYATVITVLSI